MVYVWVVEIDLVFIRGPEITCFSVSIEIDSLFCAGGRSCLDFSEGGGTRLDLGAGMKLIWLLCGWSKTT